MKVNGLKAHFIQRNFKLKALTYWNDHHVSVSPLSQFAFLCP